MKGPTIVRDIEMQVEVKRTGWKTDGDGEELH